MAKKKKIDIKKFIKSHGGQTLKEAGTINYWIDTGNLALNFAISGRFITGGFPGGRIIEVFGPEASGKSLLGHCFLGNIQRMGGIGVLIDTEHASGADFAERCGHVDTDNLLVLDEVVTLEEVEETVIQFVKNLREDFPDTPIGMVWDSIAVCPCNREWKVSQLPPNPTKTEIKEAGGINERPGERAKAANGVLRRLNPFFAKNDVTCYVVNQERDKIGVMFGDPTTTAGGANAMKYYTSVRLRTSSPKVFLDKNKKPLGVNMKVKNRKNRHHVPGIVVEQIPLFYDHGVAPAGSLLEALKYSGRIDGRSGNYTVSPEYVIGDEEFKFKQKADEPFDLQILADCPGLIDAKSSKEVQEYFAEWNNATELAQTADVEVNDDANEAASNLLDLGDGDED